MRNKTEEFIKKAKLVHGDKYDYSNSKYEKAIINIKIFCQEHGEFEQTPNHHLNGNGCSICSKNKKSNTIDFINKSIAIHGNKYDYSLVYYKNANTTVKIKCNIHNEIFEQTPMKHLLGRGCPICGKSIRLTKDEFIKKSVVIHGNKLIRINYKENLKEKLLKCLFT